MPKRAIVAGVLTVGALVLLLSFKTPDAPVVAGHADPVVVPAAASPSSAPALGAATTPSTTTPAVPPASTFAPSAGSTSGSGDSGSSAATPAPATTATQVPAATQAPVAAQGGTVAGDAIRIRWGYVQVQVTVADGKITDVTTLQLPMNDPRSYSINSRAEPYLRQSALQAQSAAIDYVSGATFTSQAYAASLQSALDQANLAG